MLKLQGTVRSPRRWLNLGFISATLGLLAATVIPVAQAATPTPAGYKDFNYGTTGLSEPTAEKPESKLWYTADGLWWGSMYNPTAQAYHIYKLNPVNLAAGWVDTGVALDTRNTSKADVLWDGTKLYVVSHITNGEINVPADTTKPKYFYRYSYNSAAQTWTREVFDVPITGANGSSETLTVAKDSASRLWVTWAEGAVTDPTATPPFDVTAKVKVSVSTDNGATWNTFDLPATGAATLTGDDISTIVAYQGRIGVMWSNQRDKKMYFASHPDISPPTLGWVGNVAFSDAGGRQAPDDHINLKVQGDASGRLFAVIKTGLGAGSPDIVVLECLSGACDTPTSWTPFTVYNGVGTTPSANPEHTRPVLLIDTTNSRLYVFTQFPTSGTVTTPGIYMKSAAIGAAFDVAGPGQPFIRGAAGEALTNPTTTKQSVNAQSGIVVLASDPANKNYYFNYLALGTTPPPPPLTRKVYLPLILKGR